MFFEYKKGNRYEYKWTYGMVISPYNFADGENLLFIPLSYTNGNGLIGNIIRNGKHELPFRDGENIIAEAISLKLPAYIINEDKNHVEEIELDESKINVEALKKMRKEK